MPREEKVMVRLDDKIKLGLQMWGERYGMTMSGLAAFIIGQWVDARNREWEAQRVVMDTASSAMVGRINNDMGIRDEKLDSIIKSIASTLMTESRDTERSGS